ncbi:TFIIF-interacting CTD phosphatase, including NLI-interacting factor [Trachipleistophora hominis]|uniref:Mitochondrial import inner membrane translocase subunit TIM50 n=1 Tax=Trachipleistophora hominis TaxID=72359 RepID=L7JXP0_TRAHO|nr:TFIIF-interacting CTD phosphatase, including NLI-interacting factor [Trachipleistophora hominis]
MLVFDLNGTLVKRFYKPNGIITNYDYEYGKFYVLLRPYLRELTNYLHINDLKYMFWTNALAYNADNITQILIKEGMRPVAHLDRQHCTFIKNVCKKDLSVVSKMHNINLSDIFLVEDMETRSVRGQNVILVDKFDGDATDDALLTLIDDLKKIYEDKKNES